MRMSMDDFTRALKAELAGVEGIDGAVKKIIEGIKEESRKVV